MTRPEDVLKAEFDKFLDNLADRIFELSQRNLVDDGKVDTASLLKSGNVLRAPLVKEVNYGAPYAEYVEFGRTAGSMPYSGWLHKWVRRKLGITNEKEVKKVSYAIAKSIKERGILPSPYLRPAMEKALQEVGG